MPNLEDRCGWKNLVERRKEENPYYHPIKKPIFICAYNCNGYNKNCGGYYKGNLQETEK